MFDWLEERATRRRLCWHGIDNADEAERAIGKLRGREEDCEGDRDCSSRRKQQIVQFVRGEAAKTLLEKSGGQPAYVYVCSAEEGENGALQLAA